MIVLRNIVLSIVLTTAAFTVAFYLFLRQWSIVEAEARIVKADFDAAHPPPHSQVVDETVRTVPTAASVGATYSMNLSQGTIRAYYARVLARLGWRYCGSTGVRWGPSEVDDEYCKQQSGENVVATLEMRDVEYPAEYSLDVDWNWPQTPSR